MQGVIDEMIARDVCDICVLLVGGAPLSEEFRAAFGADGCCRDAAQAAEMGPMLTEERREVACA